MAQISIAAIKVEERLRAVDPDFAAYLAESIQDCGLLQPVVVTRDGQQGYKLIDGAHRLAAVQSLNWIAVEARVLELAETERRLAEVEANLMRRDLNYLDRGKFLAEQRALVNSLQLAHLVNQEDAVGHARAQRGGGRRAFDRYTAEKLGISERQVRYLASFHEHIAPDLVERLAATVIANRPTELKALCRLRPALQREVVARLTDPGTPARSVREALVELGERPVPAPRSERLFSAAKAAAARLDAKGQARFIAWLKELGWIKENARV